MILPAARTTLRRGLAAAVVLTALAPAAPAWAAGAGSFFPGQAVDGPSSDVREVGDVDLARDGGGAVVYVRRDGGAAHVFLSLLAGGTPQGPFRLDAGQPPVIGRPALAAGDDGRFAVVWANAAGVWAAVRPGGAQGFGAPQQIGPPGGADPVVDISPPGAAYAAWSENGNVRAAWLPRTAAAFGTYPGALDADPARTAGGTPARRPQVAASADGIGLATWVEEGADGLARVVARRLVRDRPSVVSAEANVPSLAGLAGGSASDPRIGFEDDSSFAWVTFRQAFAGGVTRALVRRLRGSAFDPASSIDGGPGAGGPGVPDVGINGRGHGIAVVEAPGGAVRASLLRFDLPLAPVTIGAANGAAALPVAAFANNYDGIAAWNSGAEVRARLIEDDIRLKDPPAFDPEVRLSDPAAGAVDTAAGLDADVTRAGDAIIAFVQALPGDARRLMVAAYDRAPGQPEAVTEPGWQRSARPSLEWEGAFDLWGGTTYAVLVDGVPAGTTTRTALTPQARIADGTHRWQVVATDRRGQSARSAARTLRIDTRRPRLSVRVTGRRQAGRTVTFAVRSRDAVPPSGSGVRQVRIDFGDRSVPVKVLGARATFRHVFRRGTFRVRVSTQDLAGNATVVTRRVVVARAGRGR